MLFSVFGGLAIKLLFDVATFLGKTRITSSPGNSLKDSSEMSLGILISMEFHFLSVIMINNGTPVLLRYNRISKKQKQENTYCSYLSYRSSNCFACFPSDNYVMI